MKERIDYIDVAKGLGMFLVIWGHIKHGGITHSFVYSFHMPLFFFISGMLFVPSKYSSFALFLKKKSQTLLLPYILYSIFTWLIWVGYNTTSTDSGVNYFFPLLQTFLAQGSTGYLLHNAPLWFITCLFVVEAIYYLITRRINWGGHLLLLTLGLAILSMYLVNRYSWYAKLPWNFEVALVALFFYACGNVLASHYSIKKIYEIVSTRVVIFSVICIVLLFLLVVFATVNDCADMGADYFTKNHYIFLLTGVLGSIFVVFLSAIIFTRLNKSVFSPVVSFCKWVGLNSMDILSIHVPIKGIIIVLLAHALRISISDSYFYGWSESIFAFVLTVIAVSIAVLIIMRIKKLYYHYVKRI